MDPYEQLLNKALEELPEQTQKGERFSLENVKGHLEGSKTVLINLRKIAKDLNRNPDHLLKYLLRELATSGKYVRDRAILAAKVSANKINKKIKKYVSEFVFCAECGKPETELSEDKGVSYLKCLACGVKKPVKNV